MGARTEEVRPQDLDRDIDRTRQALSEDIDALQDKVSPHAIMERRKSALRSRLMGVKDRVMGAGQSATGGMTDAAGGMAGQASDKASQATDAVEQRVEGSPLAAGLVAFGAGVVIAALVPASRAEQRSARRLQEVAQEHGQPVLDEARSAAQDVGEQLKDKASEAASQVKATAQESAGRIQEESPVGSSGDGSRATGG